MVRKVNKGFSIVEVLIAVTIFLILMVPIVTSLVSSMKTTTAGKELQYRNEYAQNLVESVKEVSIDVLNDTSSAGPGYFTGLGSTGVAVTHSTDDTTYSKVNADGSVTKLPFDTYQITGKTNLGVEKAEYSYLIEMSSKKYAEAESLGGMDPNNLKSGIVQDLDKSKMALISANFANYDTPAYDALLTKKMSELRKRKEKNGQPYNPVSDVDTFKNDTGNRVIEIAVKGSAGVGYDVTCTLNYTDNCGEASESGITIGKAAGIVEYKPYVKHFDELSDIYLMYNVCVYNNQYANDFITFDLSGLDENTKINVFVIETASDYSTDLKAANTSEGANWLKGGTNGLYRKAGAAVRDSVEINMALKNASLTDKKRDNFHVYHNMLKPSVDDYPTTAEYNAAVAEWNNHSKNVDVKYDSTAVTKVQNIYNDTSHVYEAVPHIAGLNKAQDANRGLYEIKVWMQKGSVDATSLKAGDPVLQGTRGGGEID